MPRSCWIVLLLATLADPAYAADPIANGWRGNGTGLWPDATPPLEWSRTPRGALEGLRAQADRPKDDKPGEAPLVEKGLVRDWLVLGPFAVKDSVADFDQDLSKGEADVEPAAKDKFGDLAWKQTSVPPDDVMVFGTAELPWLDLAKAVGFARNQIAYAHAYLHSPKGGWARIVVDHAQGLAAWVNGKRVYRSPQRNVSLGFYTAISKYELSH